MEKLILETQNLLGSLSVFYAKLHNFHWNVTGLKFKELHKFYEKEYDSVTEEMDEVAENLLMIGVTPISTLKEHLEHSFIEEVAASEGEQLKGLTHVLSDYKLLFAKFHEILELAEEANQVGLADLMTQLIVKYNKKIWILSATLS